MKRGVLVQTNKAKKVGFVKGGRGVYFWKFDEKKKKRPEIRIVGVRQTNGVRQEGNKGWLGGLGIFKKGKKKVRGQGVSVLWRGGGVIIKGRS